MLPFLASCGTHYAPIRSANDTPADVPDAALVAPCDTAETDPATNTALALELSVTRRQRGDCAARMDGVRQWRTDALRRAEELRKASAAPLPSK